MPALSVVVPARNAARTLPATLEALALQRVPGGHEVIVVDDGSVDATAELARRAALGPVLHAGGVGPARARNLGAAAADRDARALAFTDADCIPRPGWLDAGLAGLARAELVQGRVLPAGPAGPFDRTLRVEGPSALFESANLFVDRALFDRLGGFEGWLGPSGGKELGEDTWLGWRVRRAGGRTAFCAGAVVEHAVFGRGPLAFAAERARLRYFPPLVARIPELRREALHARIFLTPRSQRFDLALAGLPLARRRPALAALLAVPYGSELARAAWPWGGSLGLRVAVALLAADAVGAAALAAGSVRTGSVVL